MNVSLDPEMIKEIIREQVNIQGDEDGQIVEDVDSLKEDNPETKSFFEKVVEFVFSKLFLR